MHPVLRAALDDAVEAFGPDQVTFTELPGGPVKVTVSGQDIGEGWEPRIVSVTATLLATYPSPPPYPFYLPAGLRRTDGAAVGNLTEATIDGTTATQLSVRPKDGRPASSLPALIRGVVSWLRGR
jgi:hypothetical protein